MSDSDGNSPPTVEFADDEFRCASCRKVFPGQNAQERSSDLATVCSTCYDASGDWQCDRCYHVRPAGSGFEQDDGSILCESCNE